MGMLAAFAMMKGQIGAQGATTAAGQQMDWGLQGLNQGEMIWDKATGRYMPYEQTGTMANTMLQEGMGPQGEFGRKFTLADFHKDPAHDWNMQEGAKAIMGSNAVRGGALSGGTMKSLTNFGQQQASNEFGNAASRFERNQDRNFGQLSSLAGMGLNAVNANNAIDMDWAKTQMGQYNNLGTAQASGTLGAAKAWSGAMGSLAGLSS